MNIIEKKFELTQIAINALKELESEGRPMVQMASETIHFVVPANKEGLRFGKLMNIFIKKLQLAGAIVIQEHGREISLEEVEDQLNMSIGISKKNIQDMIVKHKLTDLDKTGFVEKLKTDSLPH